MARLKIAAYVAAATQLVATVGRVLFTARGSHYFEEERVGRVLFINQHTS